MASIRAQAIILIILTSLLVVPALARIKYLDSSPGSDRVYRRDQRVYSPGSDIQIAVVIENNGMSLDKQVASNIIDRDDPPTTAKFVTVTMTDR